LFFVLSKILDILLSPLTWALALGALAVPWRRRALANRRVMRRKRALAIAAVGVLYVFSIEPTSDYLWHGLEKGARRTMDPAVTYDAVVLLGGVVEERAVDEYGQQAYNDNSERLIETFELLRSGKARYAILSGAGIPGLPFESTEAGVEVLALTRWGIERDRIIVEDQSKYTRENAVNTAEIVRARGFRRVVVVTSAFHTLRSVGCFKKVGLDVDWDPVDYRGYARGWQPMSFAPRAKYLDTSVAALREHSGRAIYRARGYSE
jgi:uncharacterized SAM-binding protein YcdF (DUF218 family)